MRSHGSRFRRSRVLSAPPGVVLTRFHRMARWALAVCIRTHKTSHWKVCVDSHARWCSHHPFFVSFCCSSMSSSPPLRLSCFCSSLSSSPITLLLLSLLSASSSYLLPLLRPLLFPRPSPPSCFLLVVDSDDLFRQFALIQLVITVLWFYMIMVSARARRLNEVRKRAALAVPSDH